MNPALSPSAFSINNLDVPGVASIRFLDKYGLGTRFIDDVLPLNNFVFDQRSTAIVVRKVVVVNRFLG